jgi:hypothetical protein
VADNRDARPGAAPPAEDSGGEPPFSRSGLVYVTCPACGSQIREPFMPTSQPVAYVHRHSRGANARLVVVAVGARGGPEVTVVRRTESLEAALVRVAGGG